MINKKVLEIIRKIDNGKFLSVAKHIAKIVSMRNGNAFLSKKRKDATFFESDIRIKKNISVDNSNITPQ